MWPSTTPLNALTGYLMDIGRGDEHEAGLDRGAYERVTEHVSRHLIDRGGQREQLPGLAIAIRDDVANVGRSDCERAGLVEQDGPRFAERLDRARALDDHAVAGRTREA